MKKEEINQLAKACLCDRKNLNNLIKLLEQLTVFHFANCQISKSESTRIELVKAIVKVFEGLHERKEYDIFLKESSDCSDAKYVFQKWMKDNFWSFFESLLEWLDGCTSGPFASCAIYSLLVLLRIEMEQSKSEDINFPNESFVRIMSAVISLDEILIKSFLSLFVNKYDDIRFYTMRNVKRVYELKGKEVFNKLLIIMIQVKKPEEMMNGSFWMKNVEHKGYGFQTFKGHRHEFSEAWLSIMSSIPSGHVEHYRKVLSVLHESVIPYMVNPCMLMDFLTDSYDQGGLTSLLALNGLFILIAKYNLDYPNFFTKLYALFDANIFHLKYRARFFKLVDLFLQSTLLPSYLVASFIKKIARLCLHAPPSSIVWALPLIYNLLKRHPACIPLIHRISNSPEINYSDLQCHDVFDFYESDPSKTNAINSSLWELEVILNHYHHGVSTLATIFKEKLVKQEFKIEEFTSSTYQSVRILLIFR